MKREREEGKERGEREGGREGVKEEREGRGRDVCGWKDGGSGRGLLCVFLCATL